MANTRISELVVATSLDSNTQNTLLVIVDKSSGTPVTKQVELQKIDNVLDFTVDKANSAAIYANGAFVQANAAFNQANSAIDSWSRIQSNSAFNHANLSFDHANAAFIQANTPTDVANSASLYANGAFEEANAAFIQANTPSHRANSGALYANGAFDKTNSAYETANASFSRANISYLSAETRLNVSNASTTTYRFDQYTGTNPTIYASPGKTVAFDLTFATGYSFTIKDSIGGSNVTVGLTHISPTGVVTLNDEAQGKDSGVLFWKVPYSGINQNFAYESTTDVSMAGTIVVEQSANAAFIVANSAFDKTNSAFDKANSANVLAQAAFDAANSAGGGGGANTGNVTFTDTTLSPPDGIDLILSAANSQVDIQSLDFRVETTDDVRITANDVFSLRNKSLTEPIQIITDYDGSAYAWDFDVNGNMTVPGDITVSGDVTGTIGASTLYVKAQPAGNTYIQLNENVDSAIRTAANLEIRTDVIDVTNIWKFDIDGTLSLPGNLLFSSACTSSEINFVPNSSGDGNGYTTIELRPDSSLSGTDQYLIIDPTAPGHIHVRSGGTQDSSSADLFFGGEYGHFKVSAGANASVSISSNSNVWTFDTDGTIVFPDSTIQNTAFTLSPTLNVLKIEEGVQESYSNLTSATGVVTHNCANGQIFYHTSPSDNFTANFTNLQLTEGYATSLTLVISQGGTGYIANTVQIGGSSTTIKWQGNTEPTPNVNSVDVISFSVIKTGAGDGDVIVLGQLSTFG